MLGLSLNTVGILAISQLLFMVVFFSVYHSRQLIGRLLALYALCLACHVLFSLIGPEGGFWPRYILGRAATVAPAVLWLSALYLFVDNARVPRIIWGVMLLYLVLRGYGSWTNAFNTPDADLSYLLCYVLPQLVMMAFSGHAVFMAFQGLSSDLVESRRKVRVPFIAAMGTLVVMILGNGFITAINRYTVNIPAPLPMIPIPTEWLFFYMFLITFSFNVAVMRLQNEALQVIVLPPEQEVPRLMPVPNTARVDNPGLVARIFDVLKNEKLYARPGLTIGELAERLSIQEYRLRRVINKQLGYRNFNQFLNEFRIEEACRRLALPLAQREPIANIAFDVGYSALSSFNKAFKDLHQVTPTQYRDAAHASEDSAHA
ncbi:MAG: AraC family transcriptional regulator [Gammaproteobacteria bacterium]|nr:AraC family transcriptional regulator [Gammaproteobacteria bacterium]MDP2349270.1 AraC family transcriptional regulator [Gammaproteobacteria bacterium]